MGTYIGDDAAGLGESWEEKWKELVKGSPRSAWEELGTELVEAIIGIGGELVEALGELAGEGVEAIGDYWESGAKGLESFADAVDEFKKGDIVGGIGELGEGVAEFVLKGLVSTVKLAGGAWAEGIEAQIEIIREYSEPPVEIALTVVDRVGKFFGFWR